MKQKQQAAQAKQQAVQERKLRGALSLLRRERHAQRGAEAAEKLPPIHLTPDRKLNRSEKRRLTAAFKKAWKDGKVPRTAQQTIPYQELEMLCVILSDK